VLCWNCDFNRVRFNLSRINNKKFWRECRGQHLTTRKRVDDLIFGPYVGEGGGFLFFLPRSSGFMEKMDVAIKSAMRPSSSTLSLN